MHIIHRYKDEEGKFDGHGAALSINKAVMHGLVLRIHEKYVGGA